MRIRSDTNSLGRLVTYVNFDIQWYSECVGMWDSWLRVAKGENHIEFYYKKIRKCFIDNFNPTKKKERKKKKKKEKKRKKIIKKG